MRYLIAIVILLSLAIAWQPDSQLLFWDKDSAFIEPARKIKNRDESVNKFTLKASESTQKFYNPDEQPDALPENFMPDPNVVASMRQARLEGDPRAPAIGKYHEREVPTEEELADHEQYLEYERRQKKRVYRAYVEASKIKTTQLREMIEKGKDEGVSAEDIAFAEDKIRGIEKMAITLQQGFPDIMDDSYQPPADWLIDNPEER
jgi:hypothetical protein